MTTLERADPPQLQVNNVQGTTHPLHSMLAIGWRTPCPVLCTPQPSLLPWDQMGQGSRFHPLRAASELGCDEMSACLCCLACEGRISTPIFNVAISNPLGFDGETHPEAFCSEKKNTLSITPLKGRTATGPLRRGLLRPASTFLLPPRGSHSAPHCGHPS